MTRLQMLILVACCAPAPLAQACPAELTDDGTGVAAGCPVPVPAACWPVDAGAALVGKVARGEECDRQLQRVKLEERAAYREDMTRAIAALDQVVPQLRSLAAEVRSLGEAIQAVPPAAASEPALPAWAWVLAGAGVPMATLGICSLAGCDTATKWGAAVGSVGVTVGTAILVEW